MLARRHIQSAWAPLVIHILLPLITRSSVPRGREEGGERKGGREEGKIDGSTHSGSLVTLEVGSCGFPSLPSFTLLKQELLICTRKQWEEVLMNITRTVISCSHRIWVARNFKDL